MSKETSCISPVAVKNIGKPIPPADLTLKHSCSTSHLLGNRNEYISAPTTAANMKKKFKLSLSNKMILGPFKRKKTDFTFCSKSSAHKRVRSILGKHQTSAERDNLFKSFEKNLKIRKTAATVKFSTAPYGQSLSTPKHVTSIASSHGMSKKTVLIPDMSKTRSKSPDPVSSHDGISAHMRSRSMESFVPWNLQMLQKLPFYEEGAADFTPSTPKVKSPVVPIPSPGGGKSDLLENVMYKDMGTSNKVPKKLGGNSHIASMAGFGDAEFPTNIFDDEGMLDDSYNEVIDVKKTTCVTSADDSENKLTNDVDMEVDQRNISLQPNAAINGDQQRNSKGHISDDDKTVKDDNM